MCDKGRLVAELCQSCANEAASVGCAVAGQWEPEGAARAVRSSTVAVENEAGDESVELVRVLDLGPMSAAVKQDEAGIGKVRQQE